MFPKGNKKIKDRFSSLLHRRKPMPPPESSVVANNRDTVDLHIRTLSTILHNMNAADAPSSTRGDVPSFLRDIATLLTRGSTKDKEGKQVVAVTGQIEQNNVKTLLVTENSPNAIENQSLGFLLKFVPIAKTPGTFQEILETIGNTRTTEEHMADLLGLFLSVDFKNKDQYSKFTMFVTIRSIQKLHVRLKIGKRRWRQPLSTMLKSWRPDSGEIVESFSVARPRWGSTVEDMDREMKRLRSDDDWEFSINTAHLWASLLAYLLDEIDDLIKKYKESSTRDRSQPLRKPTLDLVQGICWLCSTLFMLMTQYTKVVKALLAIPSLADSFRLSQATTNLITPGHENDNNNDDDDEEEEEAPEPEETPDDEVYRYLESVVAWRLAGHRLLQERYRATFTTISVSVVHVTGYKSDVLSSEAIISGLLKRFPNGEMLIKTTESFILSKVPSFFYGAVHAEATLMGLIAASFLGDLEADTTMKFDAKFDLTTISRLGIGNPAIAVGKKCCWCCENLSQLISPMISIPGSHGTIYPWCPPPIGISLEVLGCLEEQLWGRLYQALLEHSDQRQSTHSRQSSGSSFIPSSDESDAGEFSYLTTFNVLPQSQS